MTAVAVLQLVERGAIDLDAPIQKYVPSFPEKPWPVTARLLLGHLGGVRHYRDDEPTNTRSYANATEGLAFFKDDPLVVEPGTRFLYSTYGYNLLGAAVEGVSGKPFIEALKEGVLDPAGMVSTRVDEVAPLIPNRAQGYVRLPSGEVRNSAPGRRELQGAGRRPVLDRRRRGPLRNGPRRGRRCSRRRPSPRC